MHRTGQECSDKLLLHRLPQSLLWKRVKEEELQFNHVLEIKAYKKHITPSHLSTHPVPVERKAQATGTLLVPYSIVMATG